MDNLLQKILLDHHVDHAVLDRGLRVVECSNGFARFAGIDEVASDGKELGELYPEVIGIEEVLTRLLESATGTFELLCVNRVLENGDVYFLDFRFTGISDPSGNSRHLLFTIVDNSEHYRMQQQLVQQRHEILLLKSALGTQSAFLADSILGSSPPILRLKELVRRLAPVPTATILFLGESGTGKSHLARVLHQLSFQSGAPFVEVNCAAIPENLLEAELFGFEKGAFTNALRSKKGLIEEADHGTLFLDEIADLPLSLQAKLLHFLEARTFRRIGNNKEVSVNVRCIAATNRDLQAAVAEKQFREDLFYRLNVVTLTLPPLRDLGADVGALAEHFIKIYNRDFKKHVTGLDALAKEVLQRHAWPGNVRELRNVIERAMIFCESVEIKSSDLTLPSGVRQQHLPDLVSLPAGGIQLEELEKSLLTQALQRANGNKTRAATLLGLSRDTFRYRLEKFGIE
jgi:transcriptional regulator with PAS, ATPase and Fis domain